MRSLVLAAITLACLASTAAADCGPGGCKRPTRFPIHNILRPGRPRYSFPALTRPRLHVARRAR